MVFSLNEFLMAVSFTLDFIEIDILGVTSNHGKRTAYTSLRIAQELGLKREELHDIVALAILHDNGVSEKSLHDKFLTNDVVDTKSIDRVKEHCAIGEENVRKYPFLTNVTNVIKYHHEKYDGSGFFQVAGDYIPIMSQIIYMADVMEVNFNLEQGSSDICDQMIRFMDIQEGIMFSPTIVAAFLKVIQDKVFWLNLGDDYIDDALRKNTPEFSMELPIDEIRNITDVFSRIIDSKSQYTQRHSSDLSEKAGRMADYYGMNHEEKVKLMVAADLHDLGKLAVPNSILDKPGKLTPEEFDLIKKHPYYTRLALQQIKGFEDITEWASNHHEKLDGSGYPFHKTSEDLDFNSRLLACLDIYEALTEERPYREPLSHERTMGILHQMKADGLIDAEITMDIDTVFGKGTQSRNAQEGRKCYIF